MEAVTRIIGGTAGGRRIGTPPGAGTRPTSDRVREGLYSRLEHLEVVTGARVLDLYAGSGALGLEAASRGAAHVLLVESERSVARLARDNAAAVGLADRVLVRAEPVERVLLGGPAGPTGVADAGGAGEPGDAAGASGTAYGLVLLDPPYDLGEGRLGDVLALLDTHGWLAADALVVVERSARSPEPAWPAGLRLEGERRYGETKLWFATVPSPGDVA